MKTKLNITYPAFALFAFACFALAPQARAVCQQGCDLANNNTFLGDNALINDTTGSFNTAIGRNTLLNNTTGSSNTATGSAALGSNTTGSSNTATGRNALIDNTTGSSNTATGSAALFDNATGNDNTAAGRTALGSNTTGSSNTASGVAALGSNTTGDFNAATGHFALFSNTTGSGNIALGDNAGTNLTTGDNNIDIGNVGVAGEANTIRIGTQGTQTSTFIAGITGTAITGRPLMINGSGQLGTAPSSARYKNEIKPMDAASEVILGLKPVTFRYKKEIDPDGIPQFGLVAEEVEKVNRDLVTRDPGGKAFTVRYEAVNAMLLNEFLKEHRKVTEQGATIAKQQDEIKALTAAVKEQGTQIQKVGAQLALDKSVRRIVDNNQ